MYTLFYLKEALYASLQHVRIAGVHLQPLLCKIRVTWIQDTGTVDLIAKLAGEWPVGEERAPRGEPDTGMIRIASRCPDGAQFKTDELFISATSMQ